ncbi:MULTISPECIES: TetR family transcriptional regulator C-terminal domain-containing protein [unclassified Streptomyces]|uniref:TetR/AcrR family transcriptional regulator n=1 Tax=unclassified Streptomyces TaxID=2593676 RepID=UPI0038182636
MTTKERIAEAGLRLFHERGYNGTSVQDIVAAAGVPKGSFYNHFSSKETLGLDAVERFSGSLALETLTGAAPSPIARIEANLRHRVALAARNDFARGCLLANLAAEIPAHSPALSEAVREQLQRWQEALAGTLREAQEVGEVARAVSAEALADYLVSGFEGAMSRARLVRGRQPLDGFLDVTFATVLARPAG